MPRIVDHDARRALLLERCFSLVAEKGYAAVSMRQIARAAGVSTGSIYHYFPDKLAMLREMFTWMSTRNIADATAGAEEEELPARTRRLIRYLVEQEDYLRQLVSVALDVHRFEPGEGARDVLQHTLGAYRRALGEQLALDEAAAAELFSRILGTLVQRTLDPSTPGFEAMIPIPPEPAHSSHRAEGG